MTATNLDPEGYCPANDHPDWNQSFYFNFYDPAQRTGAFVRIGILENRNEANLWFVFFRDGRPLFTRLNMNLPYTGDRLAGGMTLAGVTLKALEPLRSASVTFDEESFKVDLTWDAILPMTDSIELSAGGADDGFAKEISHYHPEGTCRVSGMITLRDGEEIPIDGQGFRDLSFGPRNWDYMRHYRLAWPIFDNGLSIVAVHGFTTEGSDAWMRMIGKDGKWIGVTDVQDHNVFEADEMTIQSMHWKVTDADGDLHEFTGKPLFRWFFPFDTFVVAEHMIEYTLADGTKGYGLGECGYRFPWAGNGA
ncbi:MAG: hypothetical protein B7Z39_01480 [Novosphingobium sp. 12-64-8]|nr:MAG: hypothetical protein B7Z39_01480 [Novosphingobium sp. 12-64-8]